MLAACGSKVGFIWSVSNENKTHPSELMECVVERCASVGFRPIACPVPVGVPFLSMSAAKYVGLTAICKRVMFPRWVVPYSSSLHINGSAEVGHGSLVD